MAGPIVTKDKAIVYLDTEGLFASNVSGKYLFRSQQFELF